MPLIPLHSGWTVSAVSGRVPPHLTNQVIPAVVPGGVHTDLMRAGLIDDPFDAANEAELQWIGDTDWRYQADFEWFDDGSARHDLVVNGMDTVATIAINGQLVGDTENQHRTYRFNVARLLRPGVNRIAVDFAAPVPAAEQRSLAHEPRPHVNHHPFNAMRKMACSFGWDWGVDVAGCGIWRPIGIESWSGVRVAAVRPLVDIDGDMGILAAQVEVEQATTPAGDVRITVAVSRPDDPHAAIAASVVTQAAAATVTLQVPSVERWWPIGHGEQSLYDVTVTAAPASDPRDTWTADTWTGRVGFRTVGLNVAPDADGTPFEILVNGETIQIRGANWIPDHAFLTEIDDGRYARRLSDAVEANMNLLRVWGGGIYESESFYARCDELGVLVWQDFLFACAAYAEEEWLSTEVEAEAREAITRLSPHPSLIIWNGNNENIWGHEDWGWRPLLAGRTWGDGYYRAMLPDLLAELDPSRPYSPGSPFSFAEGLHPNEAQHGTMHIWDVWNELDYTAYRRYTPRFVSEFGFQGPPAWSTLLRVVHDEPLDPYGAQMLVHQKAHDGNLKLERGLHGHLPEPSTIEEWHFATQLNQAQAIRFGVEHFRSLTPHNSGCIVWQLNDNWPVVSWAAVDFDEHRKPLWFALRNAYRPRLATFQPRSDGLALVLVNDTAADWTGRFRLSRRSFDGRILAADELRAAVTARGATTIALPAAVAIPGDPTAEVLVAEFYDGAFARAYLDFAEVVDQDLDPDPISATAVAVAGGCLVTVTARSYVRDLTLQVDRVDPHATVDDALVTLLPGENAHFRITSGTDVEPQEFIESLVLRHANGLVRSPVIRR